ncbi:hypothetical protein ACFYOF_18215 [Streptomyces sp. NPDC007148]|uniref:hypothetical protein n=1 Tax=unclassified Streptomyces TaxID=2593676 RepID=UPI0036835D27
MSTTIKWLVPAKRGSLAGTKHQPIDYLMVAQMSVSLPETGVAPGIIPVVMLALFPVTEVILTAMGVPPTVRLAPTGILAGVVGQVTVSWLAIPPVKLTVEVESVRSGPHSPRPSPPIAPCRQLSPGCIALSLLCVVVAAAAGLAMPASARTRETPTLPTTHLRLRPIDFSDLKGFTRAHSWA